MRRRFLVWGAGLAGVIGILSLAAVSVVRQAAKTTAAAETFQTPWGEPDLQGHMVSFRGCATGTPRGVCRARVFTGEEMAALDRQKVQNSGRDVREGPGSEEDVEGAYNAVFNSVLRTGRRPR